MKRTVAVILACMISVLSLGAQNSNAQNSGGTNSDDKITVPGSLAQRIMHMERYDPMPGDIYSLTLDMGGRDPKPVEYIAMLQEDYLLELPIIGSLNVKGMSYSQLRTTITRRIRAAMPIQYLNFSLHTPAKFDIFVFGKVKLPSMITVDSLTRLSEALAKVGGFEADAGSRKIEVTGKGGKKTLDFMSYYTSGSLAQDPYLRPGDRVFVPGRERSVTVTGAVGLPDEYEILPGDTLETILRHAGGLSPTAEPDGISVLRLNTRNLYQVVADRIDPASFLLEKGDRITVRSTLENIDHITVEGAIFGTVVKDAGLQSIPVGSLRFSLPYHPGITLLETLEAVGGPTPFAESTGAYIIRKDSGGRIAVPSLSVLWEKRDPSLDMRLEPDDYLVIPMKKLQVFISGEVMRAGTYGYTEGYTVTDYLQSAGGVNVKRAAKNSFFFVSDTGRRTRVDIDTPVPLDSHIYVGRSGWATAQDVFGDIFIFTGWITGIVFVLDAIFDFGDKLGYW